MRTATMSQGEIDQRVVALYAAQQKELLAMARQSLLPTLELDTTAGDWLFYSQPSHRRVRT